MVPLLILFCLGIAFYTMSQIRTGSFSGKNSAWKQAAEKAKKKREEQEKKKSEDTKE